MALFYRLVDGKRLTSMPPFRNNLTIFDVSWLVVAFWWICGLLQMYKDQYYKTTEYQSKQQTHALFFCQIVEQGTHADGLPIAERSPDGSGQIDKDRQ